MENRTPGYRLTPLSKIILTVLGLGIVGVSTWRWAPSLFPEAKEGQNSVIPKKAELPTVADETAAAPNASVELSGTEPGCTNLPEVRVLLWAWNAQMGWMFANGGPQAAVNSLMCKHGVNLKMVRQDDVSQMQAELIKFAKEVKGGAAQPATGAHFVAIMGDGAASFLAGITPTLKGLGPDYVAQVVGSAGYSRGEDKLMGPPDWKKNVQSARGGVIAGVLRDGDWNIAMKWAGDNELCNNPDEKTYDPNCLNWVAADSYTDASQKYVANYCETRAVVQNGKKTGEKKNVCVNAVVTWTPGDVTVAQQKGGLVSIASTKEYSAQMPNAIIGIKKWNHANEKTVEGMLEAIFEGGDAVRKSQQALNRAAAVSAKVYGEQDADYWLKYYRGVVESDKQGLQVELGGSKVNNLNDNLHLFGLTQGAANAFAATYTVFGDIVVQQYRSLVPSYPPVAEILDTSFLAHLNQAPKPAIAAEAPTFTEAPMKEKISQKAWRLTFETGKATFTPDASTELEKLQSDLIVAGNTIVEIHGHTDNVGDSKANMDLSEARAFAVKTWLEKKAPVNFPQGRLRVFKHGDTMPLQPNTSPEGRAQNRRVEIVLGT
jgi:outer membrane protein OmpA-like peptidoglycan-associated protein